MLGTGLTGTIKEEVNHEEWQTVVIGVRRILKTRAEAMDRKKEIKLKKSRDYIIDLIKSNNL